MADDRFPDEQLLIGLVVDNFDLLKHAPGLTTAHFRLKDHALIFDKVLSGRHAGHRRFDIERMRTGSAEIGLYVVRLADEGVRRSHGEEEFAEVIVRETAHRIIGSIRTIADRAMWFEQLFKACGTKDIGASEYLLASAIGRHVRLATGNCYPGYGLLARECGFNIKTVERGIPILKTAKHLHVGRSRPVLFTPIVLRKLEAAKQAIESKVVATKPTPETAADEIYDETPCY